MWPVDKLVWAHISWWWNCIGLTDHRNSRSYYLSIDSSLLHTSCVISLLKQNYWSLEVLDVLTSNCFSQKLGDTSPCVIQLFSWYVQRLIAPPSNPERPADNWVADAYHDIPLQSKARNAIVSLDWIQYKCFADFSLKPWGPSQPATRVEIQQSFHQWARCDYAWLWSVNSGRTAVMTTQNSAQTEEQANKLNSALAKYKTDLSYFTRELRDIDSKLEKVASDQQSAAARLNAANGSDERQMRESNSGFQSQRQSMYASIKQNLEAGILRSEPLPLLCPSCSHIVSPVIYNIFNRRHSFNFWCDPQHSENRCVWLETCAWV